MLYRRCWLAQWMVYGGRSLRSPVRKGGERKGVWMSQQLQCYDVSEFLPQLSCHSYHTC